jgi:hypothetical protein
VQNAVSRSEFELFKEQRIIADGQSIENIEVCLGNRPFLNYMV